MVNVEGVKIILEFENMRNIFFQISRKLFDTSFVLILNLITYTILQKDHLFKQYVRPYFSRVFPTKLVNKFSWIFVYEYYMFKRIQKNYA